MDREIPQAEIKRRKYRKMVSAALIVMAIFTCFIIVEKWLGQSVRSADLIFSTVDEGTIEVSVNASGKVVPVFEEIINSPINTRIVETYKKSGDAVEAGTPILKLDLQSAETDYSKGLDDEPTEKPFVDPASAQFVYILFSFKNYRPKRMNKGPVAECIENQVIVTKILFDFDDIFQENLFIIVCNTCP